MWVDSSDAPDRKIEILRYAPIALAEPAPRGPLANVEQSRRALQAGRLAAEELSCIVNALAHDAPEARSLWTVTRDAGSRQPAVELTGEEDIPTVSERDPKDGAPAAPRPHHVEDLGPPGVCRQWNVRVCLLCHEPSLPYRVPRRPGCARDRPPQRAWRWLCGIGYDPSSDASRSIGTGPTLLRESSDDVTRCR